MFEYDTAGIFNRNLTQVKQLKEMRRSVITMETVGQNFYRTFALEWKVKINLIVSVQLAQVRNKAAHPTQFRAK